MHRVHAKFVSSQVVREHGAKLNIVVDEQDIFHRMFPLLRDYAPRSGKRPEKM
jgi:hypothetical protein